jgi:hypothetical protein
LQEKNKQKPNEIKPRNSAHSKFDKIPKQKWQPNNYGNFIILIL